MSKQVSAQLAFKSGPQSLRQLNTIKMALCCWDNSGPRLHAAMVVTGFIWASSFTIDDILDF